MPREERPWGADNWGEPTPRQEAIDAYYAALEAEEGARTAERGAAQSKFVTLPVRSVDNPTDVFDDLSYKIRKNKEEGRR